LLANRIIHDYAKFNISLFNENFGALSCALHKQIIDQYNDSFLSQHACYLNLTANQLTTHIDQVHTPDALKGQLIVGLIPKSLSFFQWQLEQIATLNKPILIAGMVRYISNGHIHLMNQYFTDIQVSRAEKKARCILLNAPKLSNKANTPPNLPKLELNGIHVENLPGVFCQKHIDIGARFFIEQFKKIDIHESDNIADLGCGNGILSLAMAKLHSTKSLNFELFDESNQAVKCAKHNWLLNQISNNTQHHACFIQNDGLLNQPSNKYNVILCNPPFHQNNTVGIHITQSLIKQAKQCLSQQGSLWIVANRQLPYLKTLKANFKQVTQISENAKFRVYCAKHE